MTVKFDDSIDTLVRAALDAGVVLGEEHVIVRDGSGRLTLAGEHIRSSPELINALRSALGAYAGPVPVVGGSLARKLRDDPSLRPLFVDAAGQRLSVLYADRRIIGSDWVSAPQPTPDGPKRLVFSSMKGGVGRSTALAVLAADLARRGRRVLAVDLDLEAPGLGFLLLPSEGINRDRLDRRPKYGVVDYLVENGLGGLDDFELDDFVGVTPFAEGSIDVVPAVGRITDNQPASMIAKLSRSLVEDVSPSGRKGLSQQIREMVSRFAGLKDYDVVLVDARAGIAEISAAAMLGLGADLMLFGTNQLQTFSGYRYVLSHLVDVAGVPGPDEMDDWRLKLHFIQAKAPSSLAARTLFKDSLHALCSETI